MHHSPEPADTLPRAVSISEAARLIGISRSFAYKLMHAGDLPFVRLGKRRLIRVDDLNKLLDRRAETSA